MVALLYCDDVTDRLNRQAAFRRPMEYTTAWRRGTWGDAKAHLTLLVTGEEIRWLGRAQGGRRVTSTDNSVGVTEIEEIRPIAVARFHGHLPEEHREEVFRGGILPPAADEAAITALRQLLVPEEVGLIELLGRATPKLLPEGRRGELLNQQRDATGLLLEIGLPDARHEILRAWTPPADGAPFLAGLSRRAARERALIEHDVEHFLQWAQVPNVQVEWRTFVDGDNSLFVMNADCTPVEHTLGVDVVYYNLKQQAFVLVQYKRMKPESNRGRQSLYYRPDDNLPDELERMQRVDALCANQAGEFRLLSTACWLKLCDPTPRVNDPAALIKGMYLAREHFEVQLETCKGPRDGTRIGYDNTPRYLNNTIFTELVRDGWIGSRGTATEEIERLIRESLETGHAVAIGIQL